MTTPGSPSDDPGALRDARLPSPGTSPFRVKGLVYQGAHQFYDERISGGSRAVTAQLADPVLAAFWNQPFVARVGYDLLPMIPICQAAAQAAGVLNLDLIRESARWQAKRDIGGVFRLILKLASPELVARALPRASMQYFEFGAARGELLGRGRLRAVQTGVPLPLVPWMTTCVAGFSPIALEMAGARDVVVEHRLGPVEASPSSSVRTAQIVYEIAWH
jgi:hypothetical protein